MTHPLFVGTPVDDLLPELQWIIASFLPRHPVAELAWDKIIQSLTRTDRSWWYSPISQVDLFCTNLYNWDEKEWEYRFDRSDRIDDLGFSTELMRMRLPRDRPEEETPTPRRRLLAILRRRGIKVARGTSMYQLRLIVTQGTQPARCWTLQPASPSELKWVRAD
jgi:hypothetical protein